MMVCDRLTWLWSSEACACTSCACGRLLRRLRGVARRPAPCRARTAAGAARLRSEIARASLTSASCTWTRARSRSARSRTTVARACSTCDCSSAGSSVATTCPLRTCELKSAPSVLIVPLTWVPTSTVSTGCSVPVASTVATTRAAGDRGRRHARRVRLGVRAKVDNGGARRRPQRRARPSTVCVSWLPSLDSRDRDLGAGTRRARPS